MKIGIIVHSHTGNTHSVAGRLKEEFLAAGQTLPIEQVTAVDDGQAEAGKIRLRTIPDAGAYDVLIFGAPVRGFSLSPVMAAYLSQAASLRGKKVCCFVTQYFPYPWMGGNRAIKQMKEICESKGCEVVETGIVNWSSKQRKKMIDELVEKLIRLLRGK